MRKKNPNFNEENKNRSDDRNSSNNRRASGGRRSSSNNDRSKRGERPSRDGKPSNDRRKTSRTFDSRKKYDRDRGTYGNDRPDRDEKPFSSKRKGSSDRKPFRTERASNDERPVRKERTYNKEASNEKKPFRIERSERDDKNPKGIKNTRRDFKKYRPKKRREEVIKPDDGLIRLNKYVANAGICSRREADEYIKTGVVEVNGVTITEMGYKVKPEDDVRFDGERISPEKKAYLLLNKPKGFITTTKDERDRKTVMDLVANSTKARLFPVGRLDRQTTGVLLFTNDGHLAKKLTHPSHGVKKIYHVILDRDLHGDDMEKIRAGIPMQEGVAKVDKISFIDNKPHNEVGVEIHIGWNRVVRRLFEKLGYKVEALDRVEFAGLTKKTLKRGDYRLLNQKEVNFLKMI